MHFCWECRHCKCCGQNFDCGCFLVIYFCIKLGCVTISHCKEWAQLIHCHTILKYIVASKPGCVSILIATTKPRRLVAKNGYALYIIPQNTERVLCHSFLDTTTVEENEQSRMYKKWHNHQKVGCIVCMHVKKIIRHPSQTCLKTRIRFFLAICQHLINL
jgi:hypothetical protein